MIKAVQSKRVRRQIFAVLIGLMILDFGPWTLDSNAGYLETRHWGNSSGGFFSREQLLGGWTLDHPLLKKDQPPLEVSWNGPLTWEWSRIIRADEPYETKGRWIGNRFPWPEIWWKPWMDQDIRFGVSGQKSFDISEAQSRWLYNGGVFDGESRYEHHWRMNFWQGNLEFPLDENYLMARLSWQQAEGLREFDFKRVDANGGFSWMIQESGHWAGQAMQGEIFGQAGSWLWAMGYQAPMNFKSSDHQMLYQSTISAFLSGNLELASQITMPPLWSLELISPQSETTIFWLKAILAQWSRFRADQESASLGGSGLFWDTVLFQVNALGQEERIFPDYRDTWSLAFGASSQVNSRLEMIWSSAFQTHYGDERVIEPALSLGAFWRVRSNLTLNGGVRVSRRDYFGDNAFWPLDERLDEVSLGAGLGFKYSFGKIFEMR